MDLNTQKALKKNYRHPTLGNILFLFFNSTYTFLNIYTHQNCLILPMWKQMLWHSRGNSLWPIKNNKKDSFCLFCASFNEKCNYKHAAKETLQLASNFWRFSFEKLLALQRWDAFFSPQLCKAIYWVATNVYCFERERMCISHFSQSSRMCSEADCIV